MVFAIFAFGWYFILRKFQFPWFMEIGNFLADIFYFIGLVQFSNTVWGFFANLSAGSNQGILCCILAAITMILIPRDLMRDITHAAYKSI